VRCSNLVVGFALSIVAASAFAQDTKPEDRDIRDGYVAEVVKGGGNGAVVETIGVYLSEDEADEAVRDWDRKHPNSLLLTRVRKTKVQVNRRPPAKQAAPNRSSDSTGSAGTTIRPLAPKWIDVGPRDPGKKTAPSLAGKKMKGTIGGYKVTITFTGEDNKGDFTVSGDLEGSGKWVQLGQFVQMETGKARFEGKIDGNIVSGTRTMKDGGDKDKWNVTLSDRASVDVANLAGTTWQGTMEYPTATRRETFTLLASGKILSIKDDGTTEQTPGASWGQTGSNVNFNIQGYTYTLSVDGDRMSGQGTYKDIRVQYNFTRVRE
jgi:hypothetical protein